MSELLTRAGGSMSPARLKAPIDISTLEANKTVFAAVRSERRAKQRQLKLAAPCLVPMEAFGIGRGVQKVESRVQLGTRKSRCASLSGYPENPRVSVVDKTTNLLQDVSTLLVYQDIFSKPPAKAFLKVLDCLSRKDADGRLFEHYGLFFKLMCITRLPSWKEYILESILTCENNPFAEAAATVGNPKARWTSGAQVPPTLEAAAASDLDTLQRLSISESTLSEWVAETVVDYTPDWLIAVSNFGTETYSLFKNSAKCISDFQRFEDSDHHIRSSRFGVDATSAKAFELELQKAAGEGIESGYIFVPKSEQPVNSAIQVEPEYQSSTNDPSYLSRTNRSLAGIRAGLREGIKNFSRWSDAVPLLEKYHAVYGVGLIASEQFLLVRRGNIYPDKQGWTARANEACNLRLQRDEKEMLVRNFTKHADGRSAQHVLLYGPTGVGKTWLLRSVLTEVASLGDLRIVTLPTFRWPVDEFGPEGDDEKGYNFQKILQQLGFREWKLRFVLFIDDLMPSGFCKYTFNILKSALDGNKLEWPENVLLCATSSKIRSCTVRHINSKCRDEEVLDLAHLFGLTRVMQLMPLNEDEYVQCVQDLLEHRRLRTSVSLETSVSSEEVAQKAKLSWAQNLGARNLRSAALFVRCLD